MSKTQQEPYESDNTTITDVIEQIITNELEPTEIDANQCSCCWVELVLDTQFKNTT